MSSCQCLTPAIFVNRHPAAHPQGVADFNRNTRPTSVGLGGRLQRNAHRARLYTFLQILEVNIFEKKPISSLVAEALKQKPGIPDDNQLNLFSY